MKAFPFINPISTPAACGSKAQLGRGSQVAAAQLRDPRRLEAVAWAQLPVEELILLAQTIFDLDRRCPTLGERMKPKTMLYESH
jgi:hypothetical protein